MSHMSELNIDQLNSDNEPLTEWDVFLRCGDILDYLIDKDKVK